MRRKCLFITLVIVFLFTGCGDSQEIDERNFVLSLGIDKGVESDFQVSMGIANPAIKENDIVGNEVQTGSGDTLPKAMRENESNYSRTMYYGHAKTIILGDELIKEGNALKNIMDTLMRSNDFSLKTLILCAEGSAKECIEAVQAEDKGDGLYIWDYYKNNAACVENTLRFTLKDLEDGVRRESTIILPTIKVINDKPVIKGGAVFDGQKLSGYISADEMTYYALTIINCSGYLLQIDINGEKTPIFVKKTLCKISNDENKAIFEINIKGDVRGELDAKTGISTKEIEEALSEDVKENVKKTMERIRELGAKELEAKEISVKVNATISSTGVIK